MIKIKIPTPWESQVAKAQFYLDLDEAEFLARYMALLINDIQFPCQPELEIANVKFEDGKIWADINPDTLPDYFSIKSRYKVIDSSLLELVTEHISGAHAVDKGTFNHDHIIAYQPKSEWESEIITAYLWAIIRLVRSEKGIEGVDGNPLLGQNAVMGRYIDDLQSKKEAPLSRFEAATLSVNYIDGEALKAVMMRQANSLAELYENNPVGSKDYCQSNVLRAAHNIREAAIRDLYVVAGRAIDKAQKENACDCQYSNQ